MGILDFFKFSPKEEAKVVEPSDLDILNYAICYYISPFFDKYNEYAFYDYVGYSPFKGNAISKPYIYDSSGGTPTKSIGASVFALLNGPKTKTLFRNIDESDNVEIIARSYVPYSLVSRLRLAEKENNDEEKRHQIANLFNLYLGMFNQIKEASDIKPNEPFIGKCYFKIMMPNGEYARELNNTAGYEIRAYQNYVDTGVYKKMEEL